MSWHCWEMMTCLCKETFSFVLAHTVVALTIKQCFVLSDQEKIFNCYFCCNIVFIVD